MSQIPCCASTDGALLHRLPSGIVVARAELGPVGQEDFTSFSRLISTANEKPNNSSACYGLATG